VGENGLGNICVTKSLIYNSPDHLQRNTDNLIFEKVDGYISTLLAPEDDALTAALRMIEAENIPDINISPTQGKLLQVLATACNAEKILELGTLGGYSTIWLARALPEAGKVITVEYDLHHAKVAQKNIDNAGLSHKVLIKAGSALDILPEMIAGKGGPFDLIFIDADKPPSQNTLNTLCNYPGRAPLSFVTM
jgi:caffeoyl-CoA O-methyltransferase